MNFYEQPIIEGLDLDSQNKNLIRLGVLVEEFKKSTYTNEEGEEKTNTTWTKNKETDYNGKLLLDKNIVIDLKNNYGFYNFDGYFQKEGFEGNVENLKSFLRSKFDVRNDFFRKDTSDGDGYFYFLKNENSDFNNHEDGDMRVSMKFVIINFFFIFNLFFKINIG